MICLLEEKNHLNNITYITRLIYFQTFVLFKNIAILNDDS